jgi:hypothetical protein
MSTVVVVSRNPMLAMGIRAAFDVVDVRPTWLEQVIDDHAARTDAFVLDVDDSERAARAVRALRQRGDSAPVLLIGGQSGTWDDDEVVDLAGAHLLPLPVDREGLVRVLRELLGGSAEPDPQRSAQGDASDAAVTGRGSRAPSEPGPAPPRRRERRARHAGRHGTPRLRCGPRPGVRAEHVARGFVGCHPASHRGPVAADRRQAA